MVQLVDDPACIYGPATNDTTFAGALGSYHTAVRACNGVNYRAFSLSAAFANLLIGLVTTFYCYRFLPHRRTPYNIGTLLMPGLAVCGGVIEVVNAFTWSQFWGHPDVGHVAKIFYFAASLTAALVQSYRIDVILLVTGKPRVWAKVAVVLHTILGAICGAVSVVMWFIGAHGKKPLISYSYPYAFYLTYVACLDTVLSLLLLRLFYKHTALVRSYDKLTLADVKLYSQRFQFAAIGQLFVLIISAALYLLSSGTNTMGYSFGTLSSLSVPAAMAIMVFSIFTLQGMERRRTGGSSVARTGLSTGLRTAEGPGKRSSLGSSTAGLTTKPSLTRTESLGHKPSLIRPEPVLSPDHP
ncbi:uncharacterized protein EV422DRAFT_569302 [Fimicolochytrium jonesii]|uniref:uncharacterized protein n=1 Tax=Fimicolochytrium jonesii TaxID=1396493 RepID=UPI0022FEDA9C|nr:uncharacterized protein EV422DRAFT_569302 [Fimicolochytrium jonesii]KAI8819027.1 hypothetical protein EV422DRAFT_569302 [Fimicolochytrium jonesii]